jgi:hypothetical protein
LVGSQEASARALSGHGSSRNLARELADQESFMSNSFVALPVPAADGPGAAVDTSALGADKTIVVTGDFQGSVTIEYSTDAGTTWAALNQATFQQPGTLNSVVVANRMRAVMSGYINGTGQAEVGAPTSLGSFVQLPTVEDGPGASVDISAFPSFKTAVCDADFQGRMFVEVSDDNVNWAEVFAFNESIGGGESQVIHARWARANHVPPIYPVPGGNGTPSLWLGAAESEPDGGGVVVDNVTIGGDGTPGSPLFVKAGFAPSRTLFVSKAWFAGSDPNIYFTTISAAEVRALALNPISSNPIVIELAPGTYVEDVVHVSNVHLVGIDKLSVFVTGNISWLLGQGVNAPQAALPENASFINMTSGGPGSFTYDSTAKTGASTAVAEFHRFFWGQAWSVTGGAGTGGRQDTMLMYDSILAKNSATFFKNMVGDGLGVSLIGTRTHTVAWQGNTVARVWSTEVISANNNAVHSLADTANVTYLASDFTTQVSSITVASGCHLQMMGCYLHEAGTFVVAAGGFATCSGCDIAGALSGGGAFDLRGSNIGGNADLTGITGTCDRTNWTGTTGATATGDNIIAISPPYPNTTNMVVMAVQDTGTATPFKIPLAQIAVNQFVLNDPSAGGNTFNYVIVKD